MRRRRDVQERCHASSAARTRGRVRCCGCDSRRCVGAPAAFWRGAARPSAGYDPRADDCYGPPDQRGWVPEADLWTWRAAPRAGRCGDRRSQGSLLAPPVAARARPVHRPADSGLAIPGAGGVPRAPQRWVQRQRRVDSAGSAKIQFAACYRPQEMLTAQVTEALFRAVGALGVGRRPVERWTSRSPPGTRWITVSTTSCGG
jgi:hypothetical protein